MEPKIVERQSFEVMGVLARVIPASADFNDIWMNQFIARHDEVKPHSTDGAYYGVCFCEGKETIDYVAGMAIGDVTTVPEGRVVREVPAAIDVEDPEHRAVFECTVATISQTYGFILHGEWLPDSEYDYDHSAPDFEHYPPDTATGESPVFLHIPVTKRGTA